MCVVRLHGMLSTLRIIRRHTRSRGDALGAFCDDFFLL